MKNVSEVVGAIKPESFNATQFFQFMLFLLIGSLVIGFIGRFVFGKKSALNQSVSAAIAILFVYVVTVVIHSTGLKLDFILSPLPFVTIDGEYLTIFPIFSSGFTEICAQILSTVILAFVMNLLVSILPEGKKLLTWYLFRFLSVVLAIILHYLVNLLLSAFLPQGFTEIAPVVLLIILVAALLLGALKLVVGGILAFFDPILAILYTFFFSNLIGKQLSKAILTTIILAALVCLLNYLGITAVYIASAVLVAFIPLLIVVLILWYVIGHLL